MKKCVVLGIFYVTIISCEEHVTEVPHAEASSPVAHSATNAEAAPASLPAITVDPLGDSARGNWYLKRNTLLRARPVYERIRTLVEDILRSVEQLIEQYNPYDQRLQTEVQEVGLSLATIDAALTKVLEQIKQDREQTTQPTEEQRKKLLDLNETKVLLETLKREYAYLASMSTGLTQALQLMRTQSEQAQLFEQKAWHHYEAIDEMLNDKQAEHLFDEMQAFRENTEQILIYVTRDLVQFCTQAAQSFNEQKKRVIVTLEQLESRGILLTKKQEQKIAQEKPQEAPKKIEQSWMEWILSPFMRLWGWLKGWLMGVSRS